MKTEEVKQLLQKYFDGESTIEEEKSLESYFSSENVNEEVKKYSGFFEGISELSRAEISDNIEEDLMSCLIEKQSGEKTKYRRIWQAISGIAASIIIIAGGMLLFRQNEQPFKDTFDNPQIAYAYAEQTLGYISTKYNKGLEGFENFEKLQTAVQPMEKGVKPINKVFEDIGIINTDHTR